jgi:hypothetical protein
MTSTTTSALPKIVRIVTAWKYSVTPDLGGTAAQVAHSDEFHLEVLEVLPPGPAATGQPA